jgi:3-oxoadipate enol-lactonase
MGGKSMQVKANGIQMNYELAGKDDGEVVIFSHSLGCSLAMWDPQMDSLEPYFGILRYDVRGHGLSQASVGAYSLKLLGEDAIALLDALDIDAVHWVGLSMGGMIGEYLALNHAYRLRSLILCDTSAAIPEEAQPLWQERIDAARDKGMEALIEAVVERWLSPSFIDGNSGMVARIRKQFLATSVDGYVGCSEAISKLNYLDQLANIDIPTLIIVGEDDPGTPVAASKVMHERIPNSKLIVIPSARHLSNLEQPKLFNTALLDFLGKGSKKRVNH